ncbi:MAG: hypothetical protein WD045_13760 [Pirellulaceae bacterium]
MPKRRNYGSGILALLAGLLVTNIALAQFDFEREPISYNDATPENPISRLQRQLANGEQQLEYSPRDGYLPSLLELLEVPVESQGLVFSKTSLQVRRITPRNPRAIYFNDDIYVGHVPGGDLVEISVADPHLGAVFYTLNQRETAKPSLQRQTHQCTQCHVGSMTKNVPGHMVRSVYPGADGRPELKHGSFITTPASPLKERWGGWYVTGTHGRDHHLGNTTIRSSESPNSIDRGRGANVTELSSYLDTGRYLSPHSDLVALMVLEHQTEMHNLITAAHFQAIHTQTDALAMNRALEREDDFESDSTLRRLDNAAEKVVEGLLFVGEYRLKSPVLGTSDFTKTFASRGPQDDQGRSLRQFDLQTRMFKFPCSYLIYSEAFQALPSAVKSRVYARLGEILMNEEPRNSDSEEDKFAQLSQADRRAIREILQVTLDDLPPDWPGAP